ncbi:hypothetical protein BDV12DRAFT_199073 [Aspergillus spectabilis]
MLQYLASIFQVYGVYVDRVLKKTPWASLMIQLNEVRHAHSTAMIVELFYEAVALKEGLSIATQMVLSDLYRLFSCYYLELAGTDCERY